MEFKMKLKRGLAVALSSLMLLGSVGNVTVFQTTAVASEDRLSIGRIVDESKKTLGPDMVQTVYEIEGSSGMQKVYKLEADPFNEFFKIETAISNETVNGYEKTTDMANRVDSDGNSVVGAINGDFYDTSSGIPIGMMVKGGEIVATSSNWSGIGFTGNSNTVIGTPEFEMGFSTEDGEGDVTKINHINKKRSTSDLILYTPKFGTDTKTNSYGTEVVLRVTSGSPRAGTSMTAVVEEIVDEKGSVPLRDGLVVLSGHGDVRDKLRALKVGETVNMSFSVNEPWGNATEAIGGKDILIKNGIVQEGLDKEKNPRTAIGVKADGNIVVVAVDGRQPGFSEGISLNELATMMKEMGAVNALNLDGGGSTTFATRQPGEQGVSIVNSPSDGSERRNANGLLFISKAPKGELNKLVISPDKLRILAGGESKLEVKGVDKHYNPVAITDTVFWATEGGIGEISSLGSFKASSTASSGVIKAISGGAGGEIPVEVVTSVDEIKISQSSLSIDPGGKVDLNAEAYIGGKKILASDSSFSWTVEGDIGTVDPNGVFTAKNKTGLNGKVVASFNGVKSEAKVSVGKLPVVVEGFESGIDKWVKSGANYSSIGISLSSKTASEPVHSGSQSLKISYDFRDKSGTSGVYAGVKDYIDIPEYPDKIGMWVYGDGNGHWLRAQLRDGSNNPFTVDFTSSSPGVDWTGWRYVEAKIPEGKVAPIKLDLAVRYLETSDAKKDSGAIYIDDITATYGSATVDIEDEPEEEVPVEDDSVFKDLKGHWSETDVMALYEMGIVDGSQDLAGVFKYYPENNVTREEFAKLIVSAKNIGTISSSSFKFADDEYISDWAKPYVYSAYEAGIIKGYPDESGDIRFNAKQNINRAEIVTIIGRSLDQKSDRQLEFTDTADIQDWAVEYVALSVEKGFVSGYPDKSFKPKDNAKRSEAAKIVHALIK